MCRCITKVSEKMEEHLKETKPLSNISDVGLKQLVLRTKAKEGDDQVEPYLELRYKERKRKKDGSWGSSVNRTTTIFIPFCPFCGVKYENDGEV